MPIHYSVILFLSNVFSHNRIFLLKDPDDDSDEEHDSSLDAFCTKSSDELFLDQRHYAQLILKAERGNSLALGFPAFTS